jgi:hypothetical protein
MVSCSVKVEKFLDERTLNNESMTIIIAKVIIMPAVKERSSRLDMKSLRFFLLHTARGLPLGISGFVHIFTTKK